MGSSSVVKPGLLTRIRLFWDRISPRFETTAIHTGLSAPDRWGDHIRLILSEAPHYVDCDAQHSVLSPSWWHGFSVQVDHEVHNILHEVQKMSKELFHDRLSRDLQAHATYSHYLIRAGEATKGPKLGSSQVDFSAIASPLQSAAKKWDEVWSGCHNRGEEPDQVIAECVRVDHLLSHLHSVLCQVHPFPPFYLLHCIAFGYSDVFLGFQFVGGVADVSASARPVRFRAPGYLRMSPGE